MACCNSVFSSHCVLGGCWVFKWHDMLGIIWCDSFWCQASGKAVIKIYYCRNCHLQLLFLVSFLHGEKPCDVKCTFLVSLVIKIGVLKSRVASRLITKHLSNAKQNIRHGQRTSFICSKMFSQHLWLKVAWLRLLPCPYLFPSTGEGQVQIGCSLIRQ